MQALSCESLWFLTIAWIWCSCLWDGVEMQALDGKPASDDTSPTVMMTSRLEWRKGEVEIGSERCEA